MYWMQGPSFPGGSECSKRIRSLSIWAVPAQRLFAPNVLRQSFVIPGLGPIPRMYS